MKYYRVSYCEEYDEEGEVVIEVTTAEGLENLFNMANINIFNYEEVAAPTEAE